MALASTTAENSAIAGVFPAATTFFAGLHTGTTGTTGTNEQAGETRGSFTVGAPSGGAVSNLATVTVTTSGVVASTYVGAWDAATAGNFKMGGQLAAPVTATTVTFAVGALSFSCT